MDIETFRASKREIKCGDVSMPDHINDFLIGYESEFKSALVYDSEAWIAARHDGTFWLLLERGEFNSHNLGELEIVLYNWCKRERFFE